MNRLFVFSLGILLPAMILLGGLFGLWTSGGLLVDAVRSAAWPRVEGVVVRSEVRSLQESNPGADNPTRYWPEVEYQYQVGDAEFRGDDIRLDGLRRGMGIGDGKREAEEVISRYPVGEQVAVYYDSQRPDRATLIPGATASNLLVPAFSLVLMVLAGGWLSYMAFAPSTHARDDDWRDRERKCPKCGTVFKSVQDKGVCPGCKHPFWASQTPQASAE